MNLEIHTVTMRLASLVAAVVGLASGATIVVPGTANPFLAGMPNGSTCCGGDIAPDQSPAQVLPFVAGATLTFSVVGSTNFVPGPSGYTPDGGFLVSSGPANGISAINAPVDSLLGVFLDHNQPSLSPVPPNLAIGFSFSSVAPSLKQTFFIGDGLTGTGTGSVQSFIVPAGATRLFLGSMDGFGWYNNFGSFTATVESNAVPEPGSAPLIAVCCVLLFGLRCRTCTLQRFLK